MAEAEPLVGAFRAVVAAEGCMGGSIAIRLTLCFRGGRVWKEEYEGAEVEAKIVCGSQPPLQFRGIISPHLRIR